MSLGSDIVESPEYIFETIDPLTSRSPTPEKIHDCLLVLVVEGSLVGTQAARRDIEGKCLASQVTRYLGNT